MKIPKTIYFKLYRYLKFYNIEIQNNFLKGKKLVKNIIFKVKAGILLFEILRKYV